MSFWDQTVSTLLPLCWLTEAASGFLMCVLGTQTWVLLVMLWPSPQSLPLLLLLLLLFLEEDPGTRGQRCQPLKHKLIIVRLVRTGETLQTEKPAPYWRWTSMKETCRSSPLSIRSRMAAIPRHPYQSGNPGFSCLQYCSHHTSPGHHPINCIIYAPPQPFSVF